jgi:hypothetical protein
MKMLVRTACAIVLLALLTPTGAAAQPKLPTVPTEIDPLKAKEMLEHVDDVEDFLKKQNKDPDTWKEYWKNLGPDDGQYDEDYEPDDMPQVPLQCAESEECRACFEPAYKRLTAVRIRFEKLRRTYTWTKAYKERAFALGDSASGVHGVAGLAWVGERIKLEKKYKQFEASVDAKYKELMAELKGSLQQIAGCEEKVYGEVGWFDRYGFIYYQFMGDRYKR